MFDSAQEENEIKLATLGHAAGGSYYLASCLWCPTAAALSTLETFSTKGLH